MAALYHIELSGLRGFSTIQRLKFSVPNRRPGSGLTILVGPNNGGKSTIIEALQYVVGRNKVSFPEGMRNRGTGSSVQVRLCAGGDAWRSLESIPPGSEAKRDESNGHEIPPIFIVPSRRYFKPFFSGQSHDRNSYSALATGSSSRGDTIDAFASRLFQIQQNREEFDKVLSKLVVPAPKWYIELSDRSQYYLKYEVAGQYHNSEGLGDGMISLLFLVDSLYDSKPGEVVVIDEPELSLQPPVQRRLAELLCEYSSDRQIICATHSPYFANPEAIANGATVARVFKQDDSCVVKQLTSVGVQYFTAALGNLNNPHLHGLDAREVFFLDDNVILVEGQEDVVFYRRYYVTG